MGLLGLAYLCLLFLSCAHRAQCVDIELYLKNMSTKEKLGQLIEVHVLPDCRRLSFSALTVILFAGSRSLLSLIWQ